MRRLQEPGGRLTPPLKVQKRASRTEVLAFFVAFKEYAIWTSLEKDAIMRAGEGTF